MDSNSAWKHSRAEAWLRYADDLGLGPFYLDRAESRQARSAEAASAFAVVAAAPAAAGFSASRLDAVSSATRGETAAAKKPARPMQQAAPAEKPVATAAFVPQMAGPSLFEGRVENDSLDRIREDITPNCTRCKLHKARKQIVFGVGNPKAELVFVGEGPGRDEDEQGEPFVGRAGKLLTQMIEAMSLRRQDVYICNVVKCRPPENRLPENDEIATCSPFLIRQLDVIRPKVICCLGACSAKTLLNTNQGISRFRGEWFDFRGAKLIATYHPAYLLRNPAAKAEVWKDLQKVMAVLGLEAKRRKTQS
ncbi:MAG: uracil-DNA glycosylase [Candidatus Acidiferrales bacterium]